MLCEYFNIRKIFQPPPFLHPDSTPPKRPWIFIGRIFLFIAGVQKIVTQSGLKMLDYTSFSFQNQQQLIAGTPGEEAAHIHIDNLGLASWQVSALLVWLVESCALLVWLVGSYVH